MSELQKVTKVETKKLNKIPPTTAGQKVVTGIKHFLFYALVLIVSAVIGFFGTWAISRIKIKYKQWTTSISA